MPKVAKLTNKQIEYVHEWMRTGNAAKAYRTVFNYSGNNLKHLVYKISHRPEVQNYVKQLQLEAKENFFFQLADAQQFWIEVMKNENEKMYNRLKASELFAKSVGGFTENNNMKIDVKQVIFQNEDDIDE